MVHICAKIRDSGKAIKYRKVAKAESEVWPMAKECVHSTRPYVPDSLCGEGEWFEIAYASKQDFANDLMWERYSTVDFSSLTKDDFPRLDFLFIKDEEHIYFQNIPRTRLVRKKSVLCLEGGYRYQNDVGEIIIKALPDAIYSFESDSLFFQKLEQITGIFKNIDQLYREATEEEVEIFLNSDFITLKDSFGAQGVKTQNRKRVALAQRILSKLNKEENDGLFSYIRDYCSNLVGEDEKFMIGSEKDLKDLLYGIQMRFYTKPIGGEKMVATSAAPLI